MTELHVKAYAKLNLGLDVVRKMDDGYHGVLTVMQSISLCDDIIIRFDDGKRIMAKTNLYFLPEGDKNIAVRAARLFFEETKIPLKGGIIEIKKNIPVCAGMGGGSTDGAAVLRALNEGFSAGLSRAKLEAMALMLGSDVPFCVAGGTVLCRGRGEIMTELPPLLRCWVVICKPPFPISTPELFAAIDCSNIKRKPDTNGIIKAIEKGNIADVAHHLYNVFEDVLPPRCSEIAVIKAKLLDVGALGASMTGTGSAVFGLFKDPITAGKALEILKPQYRECFLAETTEKINV